MIAAGIRDLKTHLSRYLREVASGQTVLVTDRGRVVAEVRPPGSSDAAADTTELRYREMVIAGAVRPAANQRDRSWADWRGLGLPTGTAQMLIDADRGS